MAFFQRKEIKDILAYLKATVNPRDTVALERIINTPSRGIGDTTVERIRQYAAQQAIAPLEALADPEKIPQVSRALKPLISFATLMADLRAAVNHGTVQDAVEFVIRHSGLIAMWEQGNDEDAVANANELITAAAEYDRQHPGGDGSVADWLQQIALVSDVDAVDETLGAVTLMTLHAAKGLEFEIVFVVGMEEGLMPHERSNAERSDIEEERRLCFVGMTRARHRLVMTWSRWRELRGVNERRGKSAFLHELPANQIEWVEVGIEGEGDYDTREDRPDLPASAAEFLEWRKGQLVRSPEFGLGRVLWIEPRSNKTYAGVLFNSHGKKTLVLEHANLELIDADEGDF